ncbi:MAG: hypothetical protein ABH829_01120 [archaeon]
MFKMSNRGHIDPVCVLPSTLLVILAGLIFKVHISSATPNIAALWALGMLLILAQVIHVVHHGMSPIGLPAVAVGLIAGILLIKSLIGHIVLGSIVFYLLPVIIVLEVVKLLAG